MYICVCVYILYKDINNIPKIVDAIAATQKSRKKRKEEKRRRKDEYKTIETRKPIPEMAMMPEATLP